MLGSKNDFFKTDFSFLCQAKKDLIEGLRRLHRSEKDIKEYIDAFDFFIRNPDKFDGATIVRDLYLLRYKYEGKYLKLDADAMLHDYEYIIGANRDFKKKFKSDIKYFNNMLKNGKGVQLIRLVLLQTIAQLYVPYNYIKQKL